MTRRPSIASLLLDPRLALVAGGLMLCAALAVAALLAVPGRAPVVHNAPVPSLWLSDLAPPAARGFAAPVFTDPVMRASLPTPPAPLRPAETATAMAPVSDPVGVSLPVPAPVVPAAPAPQTAVALLPTEPAAPLSPALTRSPVPLARPQPVETTVSALAALDPGTSAVEIARSLMPAPRPAAVARLATTVLSSPEALVTVSAAPNVQVPEQAPALAPAVALASNPCGRARAIPRRGGSAPEGSAVMASLGSASGRARDDALVQQVLAGNIPSHLRTLVPVSFDATVSGRQTRVTLCVMPDYLAVGSDRDNVLIPLGLPGALRVAAQLDMALPTRRIVDAIYAQADVRLAPSPMEPTSQMSSTAYFVRHNATIAGQRRNAGARDGLLIAGHKKDVVISARLDQAPGRVAIYGWHRPNGRAIQPLSTVHGAQYADYSHGIRLVSRTAYVNGRETDLAEVLGSSSLAGLISDEGPIRNSRLLAGL